MVLASAVAVATDVLMDNTSLKVTSTNLSLRIRRRPIIERNTHVNLKSGLFRRPVSNQYIKRTTARRMSTTPIADIIGENANKNLIRKQWPP
jgi:hypothetical protein